MRRQPYQNFDSGQDGKHQHEFIQLLTSTLQSSYESQIIVGDDNYQQTVGIDEARYNLATRIMSNGVEVIIASDKTKTIDHLLYEMSIHQLQPSSNNKPQTLPASTIKNQMMILLLPSSSTMDRLRENQTQQTPEIAVGIFPTTYLYYNAFKDSSNNLQVITSEHTVINTITGPDDYIAYLQPTEKATPVLETNTYFNRLTFTTTSKNMAINNNKVHTVEKILTQVIVTKSLPPARITSLLTSYYTFDDVNDTDNNEKFTLQTLDLSNEKKSEEKIIEKTKDLQDIHIYATKKFVTTFTYYTTSFKSFNTKDEQQQSQSENVLKPTSTLYNFYTRIIENIITDSIPYTRLPTELLTKMRLELRKQKHQRRVIVTTATLKGGETLKITAMKIYKPNVRTQTMSPNLKETILATSTKQQIMETSQQAEIIGNFDTNDETEDEHEQLLAYNNVNVEEEYPSSSLPSLSLESYENEDLKQQHQDFQNIGELDTLDTFTSEYVTNIVEALTKNLTNPSKILITVKPLSLAANQLIQRLTALRPMFNAMADLWHNNFGVVIPGESTMEPIKDIESKYTPNKKIMSYITLEGESKYPIYIPVQKPSTLHSTTQFQHQSENPTEHMHQSLHIQLPLMPPPPTAAGVAQTQSYKTSSLNTIPLAALNVHRKEQALHNGGIYIRPGEVITANSDVIVGKPNGIEYVQTPQQDTKDYMNATIVNNLDNRQYQVTNYKHNIQYPYKRKSSSSALSTNSLKHTRPHHVHIGGGELENKESQQYSIRSPLKTSNTENFNKNILKPPPLPYITPYVQALLQTPQSTAHNIFLPATMHKLTNPDVLEKPQPYSGGGLRNHHFNNDLKFTFNWNSPALVNTANLDASSVKNISLLKANLVHLRPITTQELGLTDLAYPNPFSVTNSTVKQKIFNSNLPSSISSMKNRPHISLQQKVLSHTVDVNVPPLTFNHEDLDYPPQATSVKGQIPSLNSLPIKMSYEQQKYMPLIKKILVNEQQVQVSLNPINVNSTIQAPINVANPPLSYKPSESYEENSSHNVLNKVLPPLINDFKDFNHNHGIQDQKTLATNNITVMKPESQQQKKWNQNQHMRHHLPSSVDAQNNQPLNIPYELPGEGGLQPQGTNAKEIRQPFKSSTGANNGWLQANNLLQKTKKTSLTLNQLEIKGSKGFRERTPQFTINNHDLGKNLSSQQGDGKHKHMNFQHNKNFQPGEDKKYVNLQQNYHQAGVDINHRDHKVTFQLTDANEKPKSNYFTLQKHGEKETQKGDYGSEHKEQKLFNYYTKNWLHNSNVLSSISPKDQQLQSQQKYSPYQSQYEGKISSNPQKSKERFYEKSSLILELPTINIPGLTETLADVNEVTTGNKRTLITNEEKSAHKDTVLHTLKEGQPFKRPFNNYTTNSNNQIKETKLYLATEEAFKVAVTESPDQMIFISSFYPTTEREMLLYIETKYDKESSIHKYRNLGTLQTFTAAIPELTMKPLSLNIQPTLLMKNVSTGIVEGMNPSPLPAINRNKTHREQPISPSKFKNFYESRKRQSMQTPMDFLSSSAQLRKHPESNHMPQITLRRPYIKTNHETFQSPLQTTESTTTSVPNSVKPEKLPARESYPTYEPVKKTLTYLIHNIDHLSNEKLVYHIEPSIVDDFTTKALSSLSLSSHAALLSITTTPITTTTTLKRIILPTKYDPNKHAQSVTTTATTTETPVLPYKPTNGIFPTMNTTETTTLTDTILVTQTEITTVVDRVISLRTETLKPSTIIAISTLKAPHFDATQVSTSSLPELKNAKPIPSKHHLPYPSVEILSTTISKYYENPHQVHEKTSTSPHHRHQFAINPDKNNIFIVMTNNKKESVRANASEMMDKSNEVEIDYDDTILFDADIPTRDEEPLQNINSKSISPIGKNDIGEIDEEAKAGKHILLGGVLIATPPKFYNNNIVYMPLNESSNSDSCHPDCKSSRNEVCALLDKHRTCTCRPGFARMFPDRPCKPTYTYSLLMHAERVGNYPLEYAQELSNNTTEHYKQLSQLLHNALDRMIMQSDFRDAYHGVQLIQILDDHKGHQGIMAKFLLQLSENSDESRLEEVFKKHLRLNKFSIGGTDLYTNKAGVDALTINDFNECLSMKFHDCAKAARCFNLQGTYTCSCREGFADLSENTIYPGRFCSSEQVGCDQCHYHGKCSSSALDTISNRTFCECFPWYAGITCQVNLKILLIVLLGIGTMLFILLLFCILITCTQRRKHQHTTLATSSITSTSVSGSGGVGVQKNSRFTSNLLITSIGGSSPSGRGMDNKHHKSIKIDKRSIIEYSSSESSQNLLPYVSKNRELVNDSGNQTKKSRHLNYSKKYNNYRGHTNGNEKYLKAANNYNLGSRNNMNSLMQTSSTFTKINNQQNDSHSEPNGVESEVHYCEQSDRSLTVMIPRAKYNSPVLQQTQFMHHQFTMGRTCNSLKSDNDVIICGDKNSDLKQNQESYD